MEAQRQTDSIIQYPPYFGYLQRQQQQQQQLCSDVPYLSSTNNPKHNYICVEDACITAQLLALLLLSVFLTMCRLQSWRYPKRKTKVVQWMMGKISWIYRMDLVVLVIGQTRQLGGDEIISRIKNNVSCHSKACRQYRRNWSCLKHGPGFIHEQS